MSKSKKKITAKEFDEMFEKDDDRILDYLETVDSDGLPPPGQNKRKVSAELPMTMVLEISKIADRTGNSQNAVIRSLLDESLEQRKKNQENEDLIRALSNLTKKGSN